jgi:predicted AAA+ superfamily ATPase
MTCADTDLNRLLVYRNLLQNEMIKEFEALLSGDVPPKPASAYSLAAKLIDWAEETGTDGNLAQKYLIWQIAQNKTIFSAAAEKYKDKIKNGLFDAAVHDITIFKNIIAKGFQEILPDIVTANYKSSHIAKSNIFDEIEEWFLKGLDSWDIVNNLINHYQKYGSGDMAVYRAFRWGRESGLVKVAHVSEITFDDIVGYEYQKKELIANTEAFLAGHMANNVLLSGARGTGKSSSIKALLNHFSDSELRLVEVQKDDFKQLPQIMSILRGINKKFILFLDDLSFEEFESDYKHLKSIIEGGMEVMPDNVLLYATSNRRHLIRETWNDRAGLELHSQDTVNEKLSLSDRFGITIHYPPPSQEEYFAIVEELAEKNNITMPKLKLKEEALKWEMRHSGRSGRVAAQFVKYLAGQKDDASFQ